MCRVNVLNVLSSRNQRIPELAAAIEARFIAVPTYVDRLSSHYLAAAAFGFAFQGCANKDVYSLLAGRAKALKSLPIHDYNNLKTALAAAGVAFPDDVTSVADA